MQPPHQQQQQHCNRRSQQQQHVERYPHPAQPFKNNADVRTMERGEGHGVGNGLDRRHIDVVVDDRELLIYNSSIFPCPLFPLQIEQDGRGRQRQDGNTVYIFLPLHYYYIQ